MQSEMKHMRRKPGIKTECKRSQNPVRPHKTRSKITKPGHNLHFPPCGHRFFLVCYDGMPFGITLRINFNLKLELMNISNVNYGKMIVGSITIIFLVIFSFDVNKDSGSIIVNDVKSEIVCNSWN